MKRIVVQDAQGVAPGGVSGRLRAGGKVLVAAIPAIMLVAVLSISLNLSYAALLFGTAPAEVQGSGLLMILVSTLVLTVVGAFASTLPVTLIAQDGALVAGLAAATAGAAAGMAAGAPGAGAATFLMALTLNSLLSGVVLLAVGQARGGMIVRYVPLQVMAGLIATVGLSLVMGGLGVATSSASGELFAALQDPAAVVHVATAVAVALALVALQQRIRSAWLMPALVAVASGLHHGVFALLGQSLAQQRADNWLLQPPGVLQPWLPWSAPSLAAVDWAVLLPMLPASAALCAIVSITVMLNASGLELVLRRDVDVDRDLRAHGLANIAASLAGGILGCVSISRSAVLARSGPGMRWVTASAGLVAGLAPLAYPDLLGLIPRSVLAAVLLHVGWGILKAWVIDIRRRLTWLEWLTVPAVLAVNAQFGLVAGVLAGLTLGCITFAVLYSAGSPVRARYRGDVARSNVARSDAERAVLLAHADATLVLYLQGFLFFGTANQLLAEVRAALREGGGRLTAIVLDLSSIDGLDGSARNVLERLQQVAHEAGCALHAAAPSQAARLLLGSLPQDPSPIRIAPTLDAALEGCEQAILAPHAADLAAPEQSLAEELGPAADALLAAMERVDLEAGAVLMTQGERSSDLLFIETGRASVTMRLGDGPAVRVRSFGPATMVGEVGFLLGLPRTATVTADTACRLLRLSRPALAQLEAEQPAAALALQRAVMQRLSLRLLDKDHLVAALMRGSR